MIPYWQYWKKKVLIFPQNQRLNKSNSTWTRLLSGATGGRMHTERFLRMYFHLHKSFKRRRKSMRMGIRTEIQWMIDTLHRIESHCSHKYPRRGSVEWHLNFWSLFWHQQCTVSVVPIQKHVKGTYTLCAGRQGVKGFMSFSLNFGSVFPLHGSPVNCEFNTVYTVIAVSWERAHNFCSLANIHLIRHIKLVTSQPSLAGEGLGGLGDCRLLILLKLMQTFLKRFCMKTLQTEWFISIYLPSQTHTNTHWYKQQEQMKMLWLPGYLPVPLPEVTGQ